MADRDELAHRQEAKASMALGRAIQAWGNQGQLDSRRQLLLRQLPQPPLDVVEEALDVGQLGEQPQRLARPRRVGATTVPSLLRPGLPTPGGDVLVGSQAPTPGPPPRRWGSTGELPHLRVENYPICG